MPVFRYRAIDASGTLIRGTVSAAAAELAAASLRNDGRYVVDLASERRLPLRFAARSKAAELPLMMRKLAVLMEAELPLDRALSLSIGNAGESPIVEKFRQIEQAVRQGRPFAEAAEASKIPLPGMAFAILRAGEAKGHLGQALGQLADYLQQARALRARIGSALIYPALILVTAALSLSFILTYVLPQFQPLFAQAGATLPLPTRIVIGFGAAVRQWGWLAAFGLAVFVLWFRRRLKDPIRRRYWHGQLLRLPILGDLITGIEAARFTRTLGTLVTAGVTLPAAVVMASEAVGNAAIAEPLAAAGVQLRAGQALAAMIKRAKVLPPLAFQLIEVGEETGRLSDMLLRQAAMFDDEVEQKIAKLLAALVPALTIVLGIIVAAIVASIMLAVLQIDTLAK